MNIFYPIFQNPFGYDNLYDRQRYMHSLLYALLHRHCIEVDLTELEPVEMTTVEFSVVNAKTQSIVCPDKVLVNNRQVKFIVVNEHISCDVPADGEFRLVMMKKDFKTFDSMLDASSLDGSIQQMFPLYIQVTFAVVNSKTSEAVGPECITIDGVEVAFTSSDKNVSFIAPAEKMFALSISKTGFNDYVDDECTADELNNIGSVLMTPVQTKNEQESKTSWNHAIAKDLDIHLIVKDKSGNKVTEVYYSNADWHNNDLSVKIDIDDRGSDNGETLTITPFNQNYNYTLVLLDYTNKHNVSSKVMSNSDAKFIITYNNMSQTINIPKDTPGVFWNVWELVDGIFNIINTVTTTNNYGIKT